MATANRPRPRRRRSLLYVLIGVFLLVNLISPLARGGDDSTVELSLDRLEAFIAAEQVVEATIRQDADKVEGVLEAGVLPDGATDFETTYPDGFEGELTTLLLNSEAQTTVERDGPTPLTVLLQLFPILLIIGLVAFFVVSARRGRGGILSLGKSRARPVAADQPKVTFADVAGLDEAVEELVEIREFLRSPGRFHDMGAKIPKGVLLVGPPGTGKTLLARAVAGEAGVPFLSISASEFVEMFVGVGASRVRDLFKQAASTAPAIVFIDEIDAVGRHRGAGLGGGHDEREQTLNQLLVEMDGFSPARGVIVVAATNRPDVLDPALLRPGRFDRQIVVDRPDLQGRLAILQVHAGDKPLAAEVDLEVVARQTPGFTGADLANLLNEAVLLATRNGDSLVRSEDLESAVDKVVAGPERRSKVLSIDERKVIAAHEAGHALVGWALPCADPIHKVTIIPRGRALGYTQALPTEDRHIVHRSQLWNQLAMLAGGRVAEEVVFGDPSTGASNDLEEATLIARRMVAEYGMSDGLGFVRLGQTSDPFLGRDMGRSREVSDQTAAAVDEEVRALLAAAQEEALQVIESHRPALDRMAAALIDQETLDGAEVADLFADVPKWQRSTEPVRRLRPPPAAEEPRRISAV